MSLEDLHGDALRGFDPHQMEELLSMVQPVVCRIGAQDCSDSVLWPSNMRHETFLHLLSHAQKPLVKQRPKRPKGGKGTIFALLLLCSYGTGK